MHIGAGGGAETFGAYWAARKRAARDRHQTGLTCSSLPCVSCSFVWLLL